MNARERFHCTMNFERPYRPFYWGMDFWLETLDRWHKEGLPKDADPRDYFGLDKIEFAPVGFNFLPFFERATLEEDELTRTVQDETGCVKREFNYGSAT